MPQGPADELVERARAQQMARAVAQRTATLARLRGFGDSDYDMHDEL